MRTLSRRLTISGLALISLLASLISTHAQDVGLLFMTNTTWRYYASSNQPANQGAVTWRTNNYNDGAWASGPGAFGLEPDLVFPPGVAIRTPLDLTPPGSTNQTLAYYFRTTFNFNQSTQGVELVFTNIIDDGAVVYLNGVELYRYRYTGTPAYATLAGGGNVEGALEITNIVNSPLLRQGLNTVAVEVHQSSATSSDVVFGMGLLARRPTPIEITEHPQDQLLAVGEPLVLSVTATGSNPRYQWYKNGVAINGATGPIYNSRTSVVLSDSGNYYVVVSNAISRVQSETAVVQVVVDTFSPEPISAIAEESDTNRVDVLFDDRIINTFPGTSPHFHRAATNVNNYRVQIVGSPTTVVPIASAAANQNRVRITLAQNWDRTKQYYVSFFNLADDQTNVVRRNAQIPVDFRINTNLLHYSAAWSWTGMWEADLPANWTSTNYVENPDVWFPSAGPLYYESDGNNDTCMGPIFNGTGNGTQLPNYYTAYYFRYKLVIPTNFNLAETTFRLTYVLDDGAVFYVNGNEVYRTNMPAGPPTYATVAVANYESDFCRSNNLPGNVFRHGTNQLAVHVAQGPNPQSEAYDIAFGLSIQASTIAGFNIPRITFTRLAPAAAGQSPRMVLSWPDIGWSLQQSTTPHLTNTWTNVSPAPANSYTNTTAGRFFRLTRP